MSKKDEYIGFCKKANEALNRAKGMLKIAAAQQRVLEGKVQNLENEIKSRDRQDKIHDLINLMVSKKLIKRSEIKDKEQELAQMNDESFESFRKTIEGIKEVSQEAPNTEYVSSLHDLTFLSDNANNKEDKKKSMAESIADLNI